MSVATCDLSNIRSALAAYDWRFLSVSASGKAIATVQRRSDAELRKLPNPHNLSFEYIRATRRYAVTLHTPLSSSSSLASDSTISTASCVPATTRSRVDSFIWSSDERNTTVVTGTPYAVITKHHRALSQATAEAATAATAV